MFSNYKVVKTLILGLTISSFSFSLELDNSKIDFKKMDSALYTLSSCLSNIPSSNRELGCVDSLKQLHDFCETRRRAFFYFKQRRADMNRLAKYCPVVDDAFAHLTSLFELDGKACIKGYESLPARLQSFHRNTSVTFLEERFTHDFEKSSCKDFRRYVNFCVYVDGDLKKRRVDTSDKLPDITKFKDRTICSVAGINDVGFGVSQIEGLLKISLTKSDQNGYNNAIQTLQMRNETAIAVNEPPTEVNFYCEKVRSSYLNLGCQKWEAISDDDPFYYDQETYEKMRRSKAGLGGSSGGGGGQN